MATVPGGIISETITDAPLRDITSSLMTQLGLDEAGAAPAPAGTVVGDATLVQFDAPAEGVNAVAGVITGEAQIQVGSSSIALDSSGSNTPVVVISSAADTVASGAGADTVVGAVGGELIAQTATGLAIEDLFTAALNTQIGAAGGSATVVNTYLGGVDGTDTVTVGGTDEAVVAVTSHAGANVNLNAPNAILGGNFGNVALANENDASVSLVQFTGNVIGGEGSDSIQVGGASTATISGGAGNDTFVFQGSSAATGDDAPYLAFSATIADFNVAEDKLALQFAGVSNFDDFVGILASVKEVNGSLVATTVHGDTITLTGVALADLTPDLFIFS